MVSDTDLDALRARLAQGDLCEIDISPADRVGLRELTRRGEARQYGHRPNDGSCVLTYWETLASPPGSGVQ